MNCAHCGKLIEISTQPRHVIDAGKAIERNFHLSCYYRFVSEWIIESVKMLNECVEIIADADAALPAGIRALIESAPTNGE